jgi:hypothetical protein
VSFPRNLYVARVAPASSTLRESVSNAVSVVDVDRSWSETFAEDAWIADAAPPPVMLRHDDEDTIVGHVVSRPVVSDGWHVASFQLDPGRPLASVAFDRLRHGAPVSIGARSLRRDDNHLSGVRRHLLARFEHVAIVGPGEVPGYLGVLPTEVVNAADRWPVSERAVRPSRVVVVEPVWQRLVALSM